MSSNWLSQPTKESLIKAGDLYYKQRGRFTRVRLFLPRRDSSVKKPFVPLSSSGRTVDSTYNRYRHELARQGWWYAGNVWHDRTEHPVFVQWEYEAVLYLSRADV